MTIEEMTKLAHEHNHLRATLPDAAERAKARSETYADCANQLEEAMRHNDQAQRRCQWLVELEGWRDCGKIATHVRPLGILAYCNEHAKKLGPYADLVPLNNQAQRPALDEKGQP